MILLTMLLKYCLEKHGNSNRIVEKNITACTTTLFLNVVNVRMNSTQLVVKKYEICDCCDFRVTQPCPLRNLIEYLHASQNMHVIVGPFVGLSVVILIDAGKYFQM